MTIEITGIFKSFHSARGDIKALVDVSFTLEKGKSMTLIGTSGSGKTTLLHCIGGLEAPDKGSIYCFGSPIHSLSAKALSRFQRKQAGFVFQFGNLLSYLTLQENISFPLVLNGETKYKIERRVQELLEKTGLSGFGPALPCELSGGEIQRAAVARALAHSPELLLADEPTASLDSATGKALIHMMLSLGKDQNCTLLIATHDKDLMALSDETIQLKDGQTVGRQHADIF
ncbi:MAG: ABC transporter ATP-binding protein [Desulfobacula sp.]|jgi:putative ABC transport system ATP-binding protein